MATFNKGQSDPDQATGGTDGQVDSTPSKRRLPTIPEVLLLLLTIVFGCIAHEDAKRADAFSEKLTNSVEHSASLERQLQAALPLIQPPTIKDQDVRHPKGSDQLPPAQSAVIQADNQTTGPRVTTTSAAASQSFAASAVQPPPVASGSRTDVVAQASPASAAPDSRASSPTKRGTSDSAEPVGRLAPRLNKEEFDLANSIIVHTTNIAHDARSIAQGSMSSDQLGRYDRNREAKTNMGFVKSITEQLDRLNGNADSASGNVNKLKLLGAAPAVETSRLLTTTLALKDAAVTRGVHLRDGQMEWVSKDMQPEDLCRKVNEVEIAILQFRECAATQFRTSGDLANDSTVCTGDPRIQAINSQLMAPSPCSFSPLLGFETATLVAAAPGANAASTGPSSQH